MYVIMKYQPTDNEKCICQDMQNLICMLFVTGGNQFI